MIKENIKVLVVEDNEQYSLLLRMMLKKSTFPKFEVVCVMKLQEALEHLDKEPYDVVLLDLLLPDSRGFDTFANIQDHAPKVPVVVLTVLDDETLAIKAVRHGAQDYLFKTRVDGDILARCIRYGIERKQLTDELKDQLIRDELTNLYNRRGLSTLARQQLKIARRLGMKVHLLFADLDDMKQINDTLGHTVGDKALVDAANILKRTFRESDVIARIGGDEFVVLAVETSPTAASTITERLRHTLDDFNAEQKAPYELSLSLGMAHFDPESPCTVEELIDSADRVMYEQKHNSKNNSNNNS